MHAINIPANQFHFLSAANPGLLVVTDDLLNTSLASNHAPHCVACREKHSLTSRTVPLLRVIVGHVQRNLFNNSSAGLEGSDPHVRHNEEAHDAKLIISCWQLTGNVPK